MLLSINREWFGVGLFTDALHRCDVHIGLVVVPCGPDAVLVETGCSIEVFIYGHFGRVCSHTLDFGAIHFSALDDVQVFFLSCSAMAL